jgi:hypothetical protein
MTSAQQDTLLPSCNASPRICSPGVASFHLARRLMMYMVALEAVSRPKMAALVRAICQCSGALRAEMSLLASRACASAIQLL